MSCIRCITLDWFPGHICICCQCYLVLQTLVAVCTYVMVVYSIVCCHKRTPLLKTFKKLTFRYLCISIKSPSVLVWFVPAPPEQPQRCPSPSSQQSVSLAQVDVSPPATALGVSPAHTWIFHMDIGAAKLCAWSSTRMWSCYVCNYTHIHFASHMGGQG